MRFPAPLCLLFSLIAFISPAEAGVDAGEVMERLQSTYRGMKDITADFTQRSAIQGFDEKVFQGKLYLTKTKMIRWDYSKPVKQNLFIRGGKVILYFPEQKQAIVQNISDHPDAEPALGLLSNIEMWPELFHIRGEGEDGEIYRIELRPKKMQIVEKVLAEIDKETFYIRGLTLFEKSGNRVTFSFSNIKFNSNLKEGLFDFKIPKGVEVLEY